MKYLLLIMSAIVAIVSFSSVTIAEEKEPELAELMAEYQLRPHHRKLKFECVMCHEGDDPEEYEPLETENCLTCHGSRQKVADRLKFMDENHTNPHNSFHDGLDLDCYECHAEHEEPANLCQECHTTDNWMNEVP